MSNSRTNSERRLPRLFQCVRRWISGPLLLVAVFCFAESATAQSEIELKVKAAFLFNFAKFTQWPAATFAPADAFVIGCFSDQEFAEVLEVMVAGKSVASRRIVVKRVTGGDDLRTCHMLFVGRTKDDSSAPLLARAREMHILTVGEGDGFTARGGMIGFVPADGSMKFTVNPQQAERAGLKLSSKLLGLAVNERQGNNQR